MMVMRAVGMFAVVPSLPPAIEALRPLACNPRWAWDHATIALFRRLAPTCGRRAARTRSGCSAGSIRRGSRRPGSAAATAWADGRLTAYFSAEFGLADCLDGHLVDVTTLDVGASGAGVSARAPGVAATGPIAGRDR
jgi:hypothetical protein